MKTEDKAGGIQENPKRAIIVQINQNMIQKGIQKQTDALSVTLHSHARGSAQSGGDGGEYSNHDLQNFLPKSLLVFHGTF